MQINSNSLDLLQKRYFKSDENNWNDLCNRVAKAIADAEETKEDKQFWYDNFYTMMSNLEFIPSTPCLINAGTNQGQLSSCFIIDIRDNIESIYNAKSECAKIFQKNGGVGFNISALRPKGTNVETSKGYSCGTVGFMEEFNLTADVVTRNNIRKGAIKIDLNDWHPDIYDFIHSKDDTTKLTFMNISVSFSDEFMNAVINDLNWNLRFPDYSWNKEIYNSEWNGNIEEWESKGYPVKIYKTIKAKELYKEIMQCAWKTGEPGVSYRDIMDKNNPNKHVGKIKSTNPCLHKDTYMVTENGLEKISNIKSRIWNGREYSNSKTWMTGIKKVIKIMTKSGFEYITTPDHKFLLEDNSWCEAQNLLGKNIKFEIKEKNWIGINKYPNANYEILGFEFGDGNYHKASKRMKYIYANPIKDKEVIDIIEKEFNDTFKPRNKEKNDIDYQIKIPYGTIYANAFFDKIENRMIPDWIMQLPKKQMIEFLRGLFSANGCNLKEHHRIQLVSINSEMLKQVQQMLLLFGIKAKLWYHNKENNTEFSNGTYKCKQSAHLVISRDSYIKYLDTIGFIQSYKNGYLEYSNKLDEEFETVILISELDEAEVWDFTEPQLHLGITNGAYVHNCSEFCSVPYNSCNLGSINLVTCVENGKFNWNKFKKLIQNSVRFLDNMITVNKLPLDIIEKVTKSLRSIGLGIMGYADCMYILGIPYNSNEGYEFADKLFSFMYETAKNYSIELAKEKGIYTAYKNSEWDKQGIELRNSNFISVAPTGSISFIAGVSGGCEPNFALVYSRRTNEGDIYYIVNEIFKQKLIELDLFNDDILSKIVNNHGSCIGISEIPESIQKIFVTSHDITPEEHTKVVGIIQKHVDLSISKTVNLSNNATVEDIMNVYILAWQLGCKGITVYRDGCRENQTLAVKREEIKEENLTPYEQIPRGFIEDVPDGLTYRKYKLATGCGALYFFVGIDEVDGKIYDCFCNTDGASGCVVNTQAVSRLISSNIRGGIPIEHIIKQLDKAGVCPSYQYKRGKGEKLSSGKSCASAIGNVLKSILKEINEEEIVPIIKSENKKNIIQQENKNLCPSCGEKLKMVEGCQSCMSCGFSKCN